MLQPNHLVVLDTGTIAGACLIAIQVVIHLSKAVVKVEAL